MATITLKRRNLRMGSGRVVSLGGTLNDWDNLVTVLTALTTMGNEVKTDFNLTLVKMDADATITDTDYAATNPISSTAINTLSLTV